MDANKLPYIIAELCFVLCLSYGAYFLFNIENMSIREYIFLSLNSYYFFSHVYEKLSK